MSKRSFAEISTAEILIALNKANKIQKVGMPTLSNKRTLSKRRNNGGRSLTAKVNRILDKRIETKFITKSFAQTDLLTTPFFTELSSMSQGVGESGRIGNQVNPTWMEAKIVFQAVGAVAANASLRIMVVQSKAGPLLVGDFPVLSGEVPDYDNYNILYDRLLWLIDGATGGQGYSWNYSKTLKRSVGIKQTIQYDSTTAASEEGGIYIFAVAGDADVDIIDGYGTLKFKDG